MESKTELKPIISDLLNSIDPELTSEEMNHDSIYSRVEAPGPVAIAAVGYIVCKECETVTHLKHLSGLGFDSIDAPQKIEKTTMDGWIRPFIRYLMSRMPDQQPSKFKNGPTNSIVVPPSIRDGLTVFRKDYPETRKCGFIMMRFGKTKAHTEIVKTIRDTLKNYELFGMRADDKDYHEDLFPNIQTYMHGCHFGIAVFERIEQEDFNPNIALEVGYMLALRKPVLLLKDKTLKHLHTDLVGKLYRPFDPQNPQATIPREVERWLEDRSLV